MENQKEVVVREKEFLEQQVKDLEEEKGVLLNKMEEVKQFILKVKGEKESLEAKVKEIEEDNKK